jgi:succinate dehydrogenase / fumarate reductase, cytochrome b subunit
MKQMNHKENYLGPAGWVWGGNYRMERYLYSLHRITGLGLILFGILHLTVTTFYRIQGQGIWEASMTALSNPLFKFGEYLVAVAFIFHALNGLRLILQELGLTLGKPVRPIYPFKDALRKKRALTYGIVAAAIIISLIFLISFILGGW